jgi:hypothetical protein
MPAWIITFNEVARGGRALVQFNFNDRDTVTTIDTRYTSPDMPCRLRCRNACKSIRAFAGNSIPSVEVHRSEIASR